MRNITIENLTHYLISEDGKVFNTKNKNLEVKSWPNKNNQYRQVILQNRTMNVKPTLMYIHRLVAMSYLENPQNLPDVEHIDDDKDNNSVSNLRWSGQYHLLGKTILGTKSFQILSDKEKLEEGIKVYARTGRSADVAKVWNCCTPTAIKILRNCDVEVREHQSYAVKRLLVNKQLLEQGFQHYKDHKHIVQLSKLWGVSRNTAKKVLSKFNMYVQKFTRPKKNNLKYFEF
jgi:hypothetical protein